MKLLPLLAGNAIAMMVCTLLLWLFGEVPAALAAHLTLALGIMPLILAAMAYFVPVLTRSDGAPPAIESMAVLAWLGGAAMVASLLGGVARNPVAGIALTIVGALLAAKAAATVLVWTLLRARRSLGAAHPGLAWYVAALGFLLLALACVPLLLLWPERFGALRLVHLHANLAGFVGLAAIGTLQVLLPTAAGRWDKQAASRLAQDLKFALAGAALLALGAGFSGFLAAAGAALFCVPLARMGRVWLFDYADQIGRPHGASAALGAACVGLIGLLIAGVAHGLAHLGAHGAIAGFVLAFLVPLVSGAAMQLLPVWLRPGRQDAWHERLRAALGRYSGVHASLLVAGGLIVACGYDQGLWLAAAGLALLLAVAARALLGAR